MTRTKDNGNHSLIAGTVMLRALEVRILIGDTQGFESIKKDNPEWFKTRDGKGNTIWHRIGLQLSESLQKDLLDHKEIMELRGHGGRPVADIFAEGNENFPEVRERIQLEIILNHQWLLKLVNDIGWAVAHTLGKFGTEKVQLAMIEKCPWALDIEIKIGELPAVPVREIMYKHAKSERVMEALNFNNTKKLARMDIEGMAFASGT